MAEKQLWTIEQTKLRVNELLEAGAPNPQVIVWFSEKKAGVEIRVGEASEFHPIAVKSVAAFRAEVGTIFKAGEYMELNGVRRTFADLAAMFSLTLNQIKKLHKDGVITPVISGSKGKETIFDDTAVDALFAHYSNGQVK